MKLDDQQPLLIPARAPVLLIFMLPERVDRQQWSLLTTLADSLQKRLGNSVRILKIDEATYPDVVRSFDITQSPAFVLVHQGIELWRQVGIPNDAILSQLSERLLSNA